MSKITTLSFVKSSEKEIHPWAPERSGDYEQDCEIGRNAAIELLTFMRQTENPTLLAHVVKGMSDKTGAVEIGFLTMIAVCAIRGKAA